MSIRDKWLERLRFILYKIGRLRSTLLMSRWPNIPPKPPLPHYLLPTMLNYLSTTLPTTHYPSLSHCALRHGAYLVYIYLGNKTFQVSFLALLVYAPSFYKIYILNLVIILLHVLFNNSFAFKSKDLSSKITN